jgi:hypothetical protein
MRPTARPTASSQNGQNAPTGRDFGRASGTNDSPLGHPLRISATRLDDICSRLTNMDWQVLDFVSECRLASGKQIIRQVYLTARRDTAAARAGRRTLKRLTDLRVLDPLPGRTIGGIRGGSETIVFGVGVAGARLLVRRGFHGRRLKAPGALFVAHTLAVTELAVGLHEADRHGVLELIELAQEPACWRAFLSAGLSRIILKPDLYVRLGAGSIEEERWFVELDRATEAAGAIRAKVDRHIAYWRSGSEQIHPRVLWSVPSIRRAVQIAAVLERLPAEKQRLFAVCLADDAVAFLTREARP